MAGSFGESRERSDKLVSRWYVELGLTALLGIGVGSGWGCATQPPISRLHPTQLKLTPVQSSGPVVLRLKGRPGESESVQYLSTSVIKTFDGNREVSRQSETVRFTSKNEIVSVEEASGRLTQALTVTAKDGNANLHDFAMPEIGETLVITSEADGRVVKAGEKPQQSIFYVPPISLPKEAVRVGDTWPLQARWISDDGVPFAIDMVSIFHGLYRCTAGGSCADIEISGNVVMQAQALARQAQGMSFVSEWKGRLLFSLEEGTVVWSRVNSEERFLSEPARRDVKSCLEALLVSPEALRLKDLREPTCADVATNDGEGH